MKILVIQQKMIGDVLVSSIICNNLKKAYPTAQIDYMVYASTIPVLKGNTHIDNLILFKEEYRKSKWSFFKFILSIRKEKYDIIIDAYSKLESWITVLFSGAAKKISYQKKGRSFLYTDNIKYLDTPITNLGLTIERRLSLLKPLHLDIELDPVPKLYVTEQEKKVAKELLIHHRVNTNEKTIMFSILGSSDIKTYPLKFMSSVVDYVADITNAAILFNYMPDQIEEALQIYSSCKESTQQKIYFDLIGNDLRGYIALMNACDLIIGNDGGAINIAKSLNKPSFIIFSPWIEKRMWATFEDGKFHKSVHLNDYRPEIFENKSEKELKKNSLEFYAHFKPDYFFDELRYFLENNLSGSRHLPKRKVDQKLSGSTREKLSVLIITLNELENIDDLIQNVRFADEIIVVDSFSDDGTVEAVKKYNEVRLVQHEFLNFSDQRNFALKQASYDWVLFIDGDERISIDLQREISEALDDLGKVVAYGFYRKFYFKNIPLRFSGYQTDKVFRLFNKNYVSYNKEQLVHETLRIDGTTNILKNKLDHYSFVNDEKYKEKLTKYAKLRAEELYLKKLKPTFYHYYIKPTYRFIYHFIIRFGFLDGQRGYKISKLNAYGVQQRYIELKKLCDTRR